MKRNQWRLFISYFSKWLLSCRNNRSVPKSPHQIVLIQWTREKNLVTERCKSTAESKENMFHQQRTGTQRWRGDAKQEINVVNGRGTMPQKIKPKGTKKKPHPIERKWKMAKEIKGHTLSKSIFCFIIKFLLHRQLKHTNILCEKYF